MKDLADTVEGLNAKIDRLIELHQEAVQQSRGLDEKNQVLTQKVEDQQQDIASIKDKHQALAIAKSFAGDKQDSLQIKLKINELVRELDKCIAMLNR
ncbi:MAG: hypothetical protein AAGB22_01900 [Bacteroidota bacterium]